MSGEKVVLAYSGGLDTSVILKWLVEKGYEVVALIADVGQREDLEAARKKAFATGAVAAHVVDVKKEFVTDFIFPTLQASALYENRYLMGTSIARPVIAKAQVEVARSEKAVYVSHGATGKGNDQVRFELGYAALEPALKVIAPWKNAEFLQRFSGRSDLIAYAQKNGIPVSATQAKPYSTDANLMHISYEAGILEDPAKEGPEDMFQLTVDPQKAPDKTTSLSIQFEKGIPVAVKNLDDGKTVRGALELFEYLNDVGGKNGVGRLDMVENRHVGIKSRGVYESPGATILWKAHEDLESITLDREVYRIKAGLGVKLSELVYNGYWFSPEAAFLRKTVALSQELVSGTVFLRLYKGNVWIHGRESVNSLYNKDLSSMDKEGGFNQEDSRGFINVTAVRLKVYSNLMRKIQVPS